MTEVLLGGISANTFDPDSGPLSHDDNYGFNRQITAGFKGCTWYLSATVPH